MNPEKPTKPQSTVAPPAPVKLPELRAPEPSPYSIPTQNIPAHVPGAYAMRAIEENNARMLQAASPATAFRGRETVKFSNLPIETPRSIEHKRLDDLARAEKLAHAAKRNDPLNRRWVKFGLQPASGGWVLHTEHYVGDTRVKETVQRNLSPLAAREKMALHLAAIYATF